MDINEMMFPAKEDGDIVKWADKWYKYNEKKDKWEEVETPYGTNEN